MAMPHTWKSEGGQTWWIKVTSKSVNERGRKISWTGWVPKGESVRAWIERHLPTRFLGEAVYVQTPIHCDVGDVDPDTREFHYCFPPPGVGQERVAG